jgi:hypothetical protein
MIPMTIRRSRQRELRKHSRIFFAVTDRLIRDWVLGRRHRRTEPDSRPCRLNCRRLGRDERELPPGFVQNETGVAERLEADILPAHES